MACFTGTYLSTPFATEDLIAQAILTVREQRVVLDADLAPLYGVSTKRLNEQVTRNRERLPPDVCFRLTQAEKDEVVANCDHLGRLKFSSTLPLAFTEYGAIMAASVLNSPRAVDVSVQVVRAFIAMRQVATVHAELASRLDDLEARYDGKFNQVFAAIRALMAPPVVPRKRIGFR